MHRLWQTVQAMLALTFGDQVAQACGLSKATLYHYFRDKYDMLVSIAENPH